jgi:hypothetical protein
LGRSCPCPLAALKEVPTEPFASEPSQEDYECGWKITLEAACSAMRIVPQGGVRSPFGPTPAFLRSEVALADFWSEIHKHERTHALASDEPTGRGAFCGGKDDTAREI